jgi:hypothetical protein
VYLVQIIINSCHPLLTLSDVHAIVCSLLALGILARLEITNDAIYMWTIPYFATTLPLRMTANEPIMVIHHLLGLLTMGLSSGSSLSKWVPWMALVELSNPFMNAWKRNRQSWEHWFACVVTYGITRVVGGGLLVYISYDDIETSADCLIWSLFSMFLFAWVYFWYRLMTIECHGFEWWLSGQGEHLNSKQCS